MDSSCSLSEDSCLHPELGTSSASTSDAPTKKRRKRGGAYSSKKTIGRKAKGKEKSRSGEASTSADMSTTAPKRKYRSRRSQVSIPRKSKVQKVEEDNIVSEDDSGIKVVHVEYASNSPEYDREFYDKLVVESIDFQIDGAVALSVFSSTPAEENEGVTAEVALDTENDDCHPAQEVLETEEGIFDESNVTTIPHITSETSHIECSFVDLDEISRTDYIKLNMSLLLPSNNWIIDSKNETLRLSLLSSFENSAVSRSIMWKQGVTQIYVHNKPLPETNFLYDIVKAWDVDNLGEVSDCLAKLASLLETLHICSGVVSYESLWKERASKGYGYIEGDHYSGSPCLRSEDCSLVLVEDEVCQTCKRLYHLMKAESSRKAAEKGKDKLKINIKYLSREDLEEKAKQTQEEKRKYQKRIRHLQKKVEKMVQKRSINVGADLSNDLARVFQQHRGSMTDVQKLFWTEQVKALSKQTNSRAMRWNPFVIKLAIHLQSMSRAAYNYVKNFVVLPSERTLYDYTHAVDPKLGPPTDNLLKEIKKRDVYDPSKPEVNFYHCLLFDEVHVRSDIVISKRTGEVVGYVHLTNVEEELERLEKEMSSSEYHPKPAKKVLVFMLQGIVHNLQEIVGFYPTINLSASQLYVRVWDIIFKLEKVNLKVLAIVCDGASMNKKFFSMHAPCDKSINIVYATKNLASGEERPLFFFVDPPHLLKTLRNCLANSYSHRRSRQLWNKEDLSWQVIELLHEIKLLDKFRDLKLTRSHIKLTSYSCMTVILAAQVMSRSVARVLEQLKTDPRFKDRHLNQLIQYILHVNDFFDCVNGGSTTGRRVKYNNNLLPYSDTKDSRFNYLQRTVLGYFRDWEDRVKKRKGKYSKNARDKMFISKQSHEALIITIHSFVGAILFLIKKGATDICARKFNQDKLEQYFGLMRMAGGASTNPSVPEAAQQVSQLKILGTAARPPSKGNTEVKGSICVDESPLPKRRSGRKKEDK